MGRADPRDGRRGAVSGRAKKSQRSAKKTHKSYRCDVEKRGDRNGRKKNLRQESVGSVDIDPGGPDNRNKKGGKHKALRV